MNLLAWKIIWCLFDDKCKYDILSKVSIKHFDKDVREVFEYCKENIQNDININKDVIKTKFPKLETIIDTYLLPVDTSVYKAYLDEFLHLYNNNRVERFGESILSKKITYNNIYEEMEELIKDVNSNVDNNIIYISDVIEELTNNLTSSEKPVEGLLTYIKDLDTRLDGLKKGDYIVIAGRPSMGKSALGSYIAYKNTLNNVPVLYFSLEMGYKQLITRMFASELEIELYKLKRGLLNEAEKTAVRNTQESFRNMPIIIDETATLDLSVIQSKIQKIKLKYPNLGLVIVDHIQLMEGAGGNRNEIIGDISRGFKVIAKKFQLPVIAISQLSRLCESREDKRPILSDLRESGSIEQDADVVIMLYRDHYYNYNPYHENLCEINIAKFREGEVGKIIVEYNLKKQYWKSINPRSSLWELTKKFYAIDQSK